MSGKTSAFLGGLLLGAAAGAVAGLLAAPRTGRETRQLLKKSADALPELAEDVSTTVQLQADRLSETTLRNWDGTLIRLREAIVAGVEASQKVKQDLTDPEPEQAATSATPARRGRDR
ncbi:MAG: YtxH domain-containing protein [Synechococcales bacterium]|nr:YtxH domain-containing protein [Synechococcales bacterium]